MYDTENNYYQPVQERNLPSYSWQVSFPYNHQHQAQNYYQQNNYHQPAQELNLPSCSWQVPISHNHQQIYDRENTLYHYDDQQTYQTPHQHRQQ